MGHETRGRSGGQRQGQLGGGGEGHGSAKQVGDDGQRPEIPRLDRQPQAAKGASMVRGLEHDVTVSAGFEGDGAQALSASSMASAESRSSLCPTVAIIGL